MVRVDVIPIKQIAAPPARYGGKIFLTLPSGLTCM